MKKKTAKADTKRGVVSAIGCSASGWISFADEKPPEGDSVIVTNNPDARDAHGKMSHVWILWPQQTADGEWIGFNDADCRVRNLAMWHPLPPPPNPTGQTRPTDGGK